MSVSLDQRHKAFQGDICTSLEGSLQALRLWNRAIDTMSRLRPSGLTTNTDTDPFDMSSLNETLPVSGPAASGEERRKPRLLSDRQPLISELEWRISEGLLFTMLFLTEVYFSKGSPREAEYFARQIADLAENLNSPAMVSRAVAKLSEIQLYMARLQDARINLTRAGKLLQGMPGLDAVDIFRLKVEYSIRTKEEEPIEPFDKTLEMLEELDNAFRHFDHLAFGYMVPFLQSFS